MFVEQEFKSKLPLTSKEIKSILYSYCRSKRGYIGVMSEYCNSLNWTKQGEHYEKRTFKRT